MLQRELYGEEYYGARIARYAEDSEGAPALWGLDRGDPQTHAALYVKGPVILSRLESAIGRDAFIRFLTAVVAAGARSTAAVLEVLERVTSRDVRMHLERELKR